MSAIAVKFATPAITRTGETLNVNFDDGSSEEFSGAEGLQSSVRNSLPEVSQVRAMAIANRLAVDPLLDSPNLWDGKTITIDFEAQNPANVFKLT